jgi:hypothetical protein
MSPQTAWILQEEVAPRLKSSIQSVKRIGAEDSEELAADGVLMAAKMMHRNELKGKQVTPGNVAYYCLLHLRSGRRASGSRSVDAYGSMAQVNGSSHLHSLNEVVSESEAGDETFELHEVISNDHEELIAKKAG